MELVSDTMGTSLKKLGLEAALRRYQEHFLASRNLAERTRAEYARDIAFLIRFLTEQTDVTTIARVDAYHLEAYLAELDRRSYSGQARRRKVSSLKSFFGFLRGAKLTPEDPSLGLRPPEREYRQPRVLTEAEYKRLQDACRFHARDAAMVEVFLQTGMRLSELARLTVHSVQLPTKITKDGSVGSVHIQGKGRRDRQVTLNWKACRAIKAYQAVRPNSTDTRLFLSKFRKGMSGRAIEKVVAKYLLEAKISGAKVHTLRHTFATHQVRNGTQLPTVRDALGHSSLAITSLYVGLAREQMDKELQQNAL
jgi:site-specific recombinase XerD